MPTKLQDLVWEAQLQFLKQQLDSRISVPANKLYDQSKWFMDGDNVRTKNYTTPMSLFDPVTRTMPQVFDGRMVRTRKAPVQYLEDTVVGAVAIVGVPTAEIHEILGVVAYLATSAVVAARAFQLDININIPGPGVLSPFFESVALAVAAGEYGLVFLPVGANYHTSTTAAGVVPVVNNNPVRFVAPGDTAFIADSTNIDVADELTVGFWYREVQE